MAKRQRRTLAPCLGQRIEVFWNGDDRYYAGRVAHWDPQQRKYEIRYDDGDIEHLDLNAETWRLANDPPKKRQKHAQAERDALRKSVTSIMRLAGKERDASVPEKGETKHQEWGVGLNKKAQDVARRSMRREQRERKRDMEAAHKMCTHAAVVPNEASRTDSEKNALPTAGESVAECMRSGANRDKRTWNDVLAATRRQGNLGDTCYSSANGVPYVVESISPVHVAINSISRESLRDQPPKHANMQTFVDAPDKLTVDYNGIERTITGTQTGNEALVARFNGYATTSIAEEPTTQMLGKEKLSFLLGATTSSPASADKTKLGEADEKVSGDLTIREGPSEKSRAFELNEASVGESIANAVSVRTTKHPTNGLRTGANEQLNSLSNIAGRLFRVISRLFR